MSKPFYTDVINACTFLISILGIFVKSEVAMYKITEWGRCPDSSMRYLVIPNVSVGECAYQCRIRPICKSIGYRRHLHLCEIFSEEDHLLVTNSVSPCLFIHSKDIEQDNTQCSCSEGKVCTNHGNCSIEECSPYSPTNERILGNQNYVRAKVKAICNAGWESSSAECKKDGTWSHMSQCIPSKCPTNSNSWIHPVNDATFEIQIHVGLFNYTTAWAKCEGNGARLVRIDEETKRNYVADILSSCEHLDQKNYWTDGTNRHLAFSTDREMRFSDGKKMPLGDDWWESGRPVKHDSHMCARLHHLQGFRWRDAYCSDTDSFICEKVNQ